MLIDLTLEEEGRALHFFQSETQIQLFNIALPLWLAKYHGLLVILGSGGFIMGEWLISHRGWEKNKGTILTKIISATGFIVSGLGVAGFIFPVYQYLLSKGDWIIRMIL